MSEFRDQATVKWTERVYRQGERAQTMVLIGTPDQIADKVRDQVRGMFEYNSSLASIEVIPAHPATMWDLGKNP